jgi:CheY-like chemotaxis protein
MIHELKVLVADDEKAYCGAVRDVLEEAGAHVYLAYNATSAETLFRMMAPDLVIMDVMMPGMNGLDLIRNLRAVVGQEHVPIIVVSALALQADREAALGAGASAHLAKPFTAKELRDAVRRLIPLAKTGTLTPGT